MGAWDKIIKEAEAKETTMTPRQTAVKILSESGLPLSEIGKILGVSRARVWQLKEKTKDFNPISAKRIKKAFKVFDYFSDIDTYKKDNRIRPSDCINAAKEFSDRSHPKVQIQETTSQSISLSSINLELIKPENPITSSNPIIDLVKSSNPGPEPSSN